MSGESALVVWGSTGKRLQFSRQDLRMPEALHSRPNAAFFARQWESVSGFWITRIVKNEKYQRMTLDEVIACIIADIERRWEVRKRQTSLHKKRKRLLSSTGNGSAGLPSERVLLTNLIGFEVFRAMSEGERADLVRSVVSHVESIIKEAVVSTEVLVDPSGDPSTSAPPAGTSPATRLDAGSDEDEEAPSRKKLRGRCSKSGSPGVGGEIDDQHPAVPCSSSAPPTAASGTDVSGDEAAGNEEHEEPTATPPVAFDDRVAIVVTCSSKFVAATAIAELHHSKFDSRVVFSSFM